MKQLKKMKKNTVQIMTLLAFGLMTTASWAEADTNAPAPSTGEGILGQVTLIPVLGATTMDLTGVKSDGTVPTGSTSMKSGSVIGVLAGYNLGFWDATLESGLLYMETGTKVSSSFFGVEIAALETTFSYLSIPINMRVPLGEVLGTPMHFKGGVIPSLLVSAKLEGTGMIASSSSTDIKSAVNKFDLLMQAGFGGVYNVNNQFQVQMDAAYLRGLNKVLKDGGGFNQGLSLSLALAISI